MSKNKFGKICIAISIAILVSCCIVYCYHSEDSKDSVTTKEENLSNIPWTPELLPIPYLKDCTKFVSNPDSILSSEVVDKINEILYDLDTAHLAQTLVVVVKHIEGDDPHEFGMALSDLYGIGHKETNEGLVIILATEDGSYSILTGTGLQKVLPDAKCDEIANNYLIPYAIESKWDDAMLYTVKAIENYLVENSGTHVFDAIESNNLVQSQHVMDSESVNVENVEIKVFDQIKSDIKMIYKYTGTLININGNGIPNGVGKAEIIKGNYEGGYYEGPFKNGHFEGSNGKLKSKNGDVFEGSFKNDDYFEGTMYSGGHEFIFQMQDDGTIDVQKVK